MSVSFIDTNLFIYLFDETAPEKRARSQKLIQSAIETKNGVISYQVVQETLNVLTTKLQNPAASEDARLLFQTVLLPLWRINPHHKLYESAIDILSRYRYGFYDSLIIAAALKAGCTQLISEDLQSGQHIEKLKIVNPFL